jgi:hypothetical protein
MLHDPEGLARLLDRGEIADGAKIERMADTEQPAKPRKGGSHRVAAKFAVVGARLKVLLPLAAATILMIL